MEDFVVGQHKKKNIIEVTNIFIFQLTFLAHVAKIKTEIVNTIIIRNCD